MTNSSIRIVAGVCLYHVAIIVGFIYYLVHLDNPARISEVGALVLLSAITGAGGAALVASRYVVLAVKEGAYDLLRLPWQLLTPLHGAALAVIGLFFFKSPISSDIAQKATSADSVILVSAVIGFAAEIFVKRLIAVAESLFGEGSKGTTITDLVSSERKASAKRGDDK